MPVDAIGVDHRWIDRGRLDDRALRREVAERKHHRAGQPRAARRVGRHDDLIGIDCRCGREPCTRRLAPLARFPPVERGVERVAGRREHTPVQQPHAAEMQHHFRNAAGHEHLRGREAAWSVRQRVHQARCRAIDPDPVLDRGRLQPGGCGDRRNVQQQIRGAAERGMDEHRVLDGGGGEDLTDRHAKQVETLQRGGGAARELEPDRFARRRERAVRQRQAQALPRPPATWRPCRGTGTRRLTIRTRGIPSSPRSRG